MNFFGRKKPAGGGGGGGRGGGGDGGNRGTPLTDPASALQKVKGQIDALDKRIDFLEKKSTTQLKEAKRLRELRQTAAAKAALRRRKLHEKEIAKLRAAQFNLEQQAMGIESGSITVDVVNGMKQGKELASNLAKQIKVEDVEDLQEDIAEQMQIQEDVDQLLGSNVGMDDDEDELLAELEGLEEDDEELEELEALGDEEDELKNLESEFNDANLDSTPDLPSAPAGKVKVQNSAVAEDDEDAKELAALEAEMAM